MSHKYVTWYYYKIWYVLRRQTYGIIWYKKQSMYHKKIMNIYYEINYMINQMSVNVSCIFEFVIYFWHLFMPWDPYLIDSRTYLLNWKNRSHLFMIFDNNYSKSYGRLKSNYLISLIFSRFWGIWDICFFFFRLCKTILNISYNHQPIYEPWMQARMLYYPIWIFI